MPCLAVIVCCLMPRVVLLLGWIFGFLSKGFEGWFWPLVGFLFMPYTTVVYGFSHVYGTGIEGWWLFAMIVAVIFDMGSWAGAAESK